jgi:hypothetical protein
LSNREDPTATLEGAYKYAMHALYGPGANNDPQEIERLNEIAQTYLDAERLRTKNALLHSIEGAVTQKDTREAIKEVFDKAKHKIAMITHQELGAAASHAEFAGISQVAAAQGVSDPVVYKISIKDLKLCPVCIELWCSDNNLYIPKLYKLSELKDGYSTNKERVPTLNPSHINCRCRLSYLPQGFAFNESGKAYFKELGHDEYAVQQTLTKSQPKKWQQFKELTGKEPHQCNSDCQHHKAAMAVNFDV